MWGRLEIKDVGIANVQRQNFVALPADFVGHRRQIANGIAHVVETLRGSDFADLSTGHSLEFAKGQKFLTAKSAKGAKKSMRARQSPWPTANDQRPRSIHSIDLRFLQAIGIVYVNRFPFRVEVDCPIPPSR